MHQKTSPSHPLKTPQKRAFRGMVSIRSATDYSPFGVQLENRNILKSGLAEDYRMGFQGQEEDDELKGEGNSVNYTYRMHDPRLGRFFAVDPLADKYPHNSPYAFSENCVVNAIELEGLEIGFVYNIINDGTKHKLKKKSHDYENYLKFNQRIYRYYNSSGEIYKELVQKLDDKGKVISSQTQLYGVNGNNTKGDVSLLSRETMGDKDNTHWYDGTWFAPGGMEGAANGADGQKKQTAKDYKYAATMVASIATVGQGAALIAGGGALLSLEGASLGLDLALNADEIIDYSSNFNETGKKMFQTLNVLKSGGSIISQVKKGKTGGAIEFFDTAGNMLGSLTIVDNVLQLNGNENLFEMIKNVNENEPNQ
jgi:RHS repeat-associated protein